MKMKKYLCLIFSIFVFLTACSSNPIGSESTIEAEASTNPIESEKVIEYSLSLGSCGETVRLTAVEIPNYSAIESVPSPNTGEDVPAVKGTISYRYDSSLFDFSFDDGRIPVYEKYWFYRNGGLVGSYAPGMTPEEEGDYLLYIDFMFADSGKISARRTAVSITLSKDSDYDVLSASGVPRGVTAITAPLSDEYLDYLSENHDIVFNTQTDDPEEAVITILSDQYADELISDDPCYQLDGLQILSTELCGFSYIDLYNIFIVRYSYAIKPASADYYLLQYPMDSMSQGSGELEGWLISEGLAYMKYFGDGVWCHFDNSLWTDYRTDCGLSSCSSDPSVCGKEWLSNPDIPDFSSDATLYNQPWVLLEDPDKIDWSEIHRISGEEYCEYLFALVRVNAFHSRPNRLSQYGGVLGQYKTFPQVLRTVAVMLSANNICSDLVEDYSNLLKELYSIDPEGFAYSLTQVSESRAAEIMNMINY